MQQPPAGLKPHWGIVILIGYVSTISAVWGYDMLACRGVIAGAGSTLLRLAFLVFVSPGFFVTVLSMIGCFTAAGFALGMLPLFRERKELLFFVLPVATFVGGIAIATSGALHVGCSLSPWR